MNVKILHLKKVASALLLILLLSVAGLTKLLAQEWQTQTLTVNDGTDLNAYVPFYGQFNSETPTYSQFIIPASDLTEIGVGGIIRSIVFYCDTEILSWNYSGSGCDNYFDVFITEVPYDRFEDFELYDWNNMNYFYSCGGWCLSVYDNLMTIENYDNNYYNGGNLLIGIKPSSICQTNVCSWYGINEEAGSMSPSASIRSYTDEFGATFTEPLYFKPKVSFEYIPPLTVNDGTDSNQFVPFNSQFNDNSPTYSQFIIPASDLSDIVWGNIKSLTFSCNYDENGGGGEWWRDIPNWENDVFEVRIAEVDFDKFEASGEEYTHFKMYNWEDMTLVYQGGLSVVDHQLTIPIEYEISDEWVGSYYADSYKYEGDNLLIGIKPVFVSNNSYNNNFCSWLGVYEDGYDAESCWDGSDFTPSASLTFHTNYENYNGNWCHYENVTTPSHFMPKVTFRYEPDYAPSCLKPKNLEANDVQIHKAVVNWTGEGQFFTLQYKKSSEEWDTGHYGYDENWNWVWFEGTTKVVEGITENQYTIDSLESQTSYDVRVKAVCGAYQYGDEWEYYDVSNWSRPCTFSTMKPIVPQYFNAYNYDTPEGDSVTLSWGYVWEEWYTDNFEIPPYWDIAFTTNLDALPDEVDFITISDTLYSYDHSYILTGLIPFTSYKAWVRANFGEGDVSEWTEPVTFKPTNLTNSISIHNTPSTTKFNIPFSASSANGNSKSQFIIPASSLTDLANLEIWRLAFVSKNWPYTVPTGTIDIYLAEVETEAFDDAEYYDWETMEKVFHGTYGRENLRSGDGNDDDGVFYYETLFTVTFDTPFYYEGGNLLIGVRVVPSYYGGYDYWWKGCQTDYNAALAGYYSTPTQYAFLPWTYIYYSNSCQSPHDLVATVSEDDTSVTLSWAGEGENYRLCYWSQTDMTPNYVNVTGTSYELTDLPRDIYFWSVQTLCGEDETSTFVQGPSFLNVDIREPLYNDSIYEVYTPGELIWIERVVNGSITEGTEGVFPTGNTSMEGLTVRLMNDIDLHDINWKPIGYYTDYNHCCFFNGSFDGNDHIVTNLYINQPDNRGVGFIGALGSNGEIHNVGIEGESSINGQVYVGGIVGYNGGGDLWNVYSDATITGKEYVGGIVGYHSGSINQAYSKSTVTVNATESIHIEGPDNWSTYDDWNTVGYAGGIVGYGNGYIKNTYNRGVVTSLMGPAGGLAGYAESLSNSYSTGNVISGSGQGGPIYGVGLEDEYNYHYSNNYFLEGQYDHQGGGTSMTQQYMQGWQLLYYLNRNQSPEPWKADYTPNTNDGYPILQWQSLSCFVTYTQPEHGHLSVINTNNNMMVTSGSRVAEGTILTVTAEPHQGYILESLTANGQNIVNNTLIVNESVQIEAVMVPQPLGDFTSLLPADNQSVTTFPVQFSWNTVSGAQCYDLYLWNANGTMPNQPFVSGLTSTSYYCYQLENYQTYQWYVKARNAAYEITSSIRSFTLDMDPVVIVSQSSIDFGEVAFNESQSSTLSVNGIALIDSLSIQIVGEDASMFSYITDLEWDYYSGGDLTITIHPTSLKYAYHATLIISSGTLTQSITLSATIANVFVFNTYVDGIVYRMSVDTIPIHGSVTDNENVPVANIDVEIGITVMGWRRTLQAVTDGNGEFTAFFEPDPFESGFYIVNSGLIGNIDTLVVHDSFDILGMIVNVIVDDDNVDCNCIKCEVTQNEPPKSFELHIRNKNSIALTNLQVEIISGRPEGSIFTFGTLNLAGFEENRLPFTVAGTIPTVGNKFQEIRVRITSDEGSVGECSIWYYCYKERTELEAYPNPLEATSTRGKSKTIDVTLTNNGQAATGEITVNLPDLDWMSVVGGNVLPSIDAGESATFSLRLSPGNDEPLVLNEGTIVINSSNSLSIELSYSIEVVSEEEGVFIVDVTDEFTTNTNNGNGPHVEGAKVTLTGFYSQEVVAHGFTGSDGIFNKDNIPEGYYNLEIVAERHTKYYKTIYIKAGIPNREDVFLQYQGVYYTWLVEETEIPDVYSIELNLEYEVNVPVPVITITSNPSSIPTFGSSATFNYTITNHGLIDAVDLDIVPESKEYNLTPNVTHINVLHANESKTIACTVTRKNSSNCMWPEKTVLNYHYLSGQDLLSKTENTVTIIGNEPCYDASTYTGGGSGGGSGFGGNGVPSPRPQNPHGPNSGNNNHSTPPITQQHPSIPARITIQFSQTLTMTREAFNGTFIVHNIHETNATTGIGLNLTVKDENGVDHADLFQINIISMDGIDAIDGTGSVNASSNGTVKIQFIPTREAASTEPVDYYFGGTFTFVDPWEQVTRTMNLYPTKLTVHPSPDLRIDYYAASIVYGDNLLTPGKIEPSIPAELAVMIRNKGAGTAKNVMFESAEPVIVDNAQGLLIDFDLVGTYMNGIGEQPGLHNIDFGNIESGQTKVGEWLFTSSLLARLITGNVHLVHNDSYDTPRLGLVSDIRIHKLVHPFHSHSTRSGNISDFLVDDIPDDNNTPDSIYFSNGERTLVNIVNNISFDHYVTSQDTIVTLTLNPSRVGWNFGETEDPGRNRYELVSCVRNNDNQVIPLSNVWQEAMLAPNSGDSIYENKLRIIDTLSVVQTTTYNLVYVIGPHSNIDVTVNPITGGTINGAGKYALGETVVLEAVPNPGYNFVNWTEADTLFSIDSIISFVSERDRHFTANFASSSSGSYLITATANPEEGGTVNSAATYEYGTTATLTATANEGYTFINWTKDGEVVSTTQVFSFTVTEAGSYVAHFELNSYEITATANPEAGGTVTGAGTYNHFEICTLTATANEGYTFINWTKDGEEVSTTQVFSFTVTEAGDYVAHFELNSYEITATANPEAGGTVTGAGTYNHFETCTLTATANEGYTFINWTKDGEEVSTTQVFSFTVTEAGDYVAHFELNSYEITVTANPEAGGTVTGAGTYNHFESCTLTATANEGYTFINWTKDGEEVSTTQVFSFTVTEAGSYVAHFELNSYEITATANPEAGGTVTGAGTYNHFESCTLTATANEGYTFINWTKDGEVVSNTQVFSFTVTEASSYVAHFELNSYEITATANPEAGGTVTGAGTYNHFETCTLTATANEGYTFINWTKDGEVVSTTQVFSFTVTEAGSYVAHFELNQYQINASVNPSSGGTVTGAGTYYHGTTVTLTATANAHYYFVNWTKDGVEVSTNPVYSFVVTEDGNYVAHFNINSYEITATANPEEGGTINGAGTYNHGTTCTLSATANPGYTFVRWTKDDIQVSTSANYSFTVTEAATYVAHFTLNQYHITVTADPNEGGIVYGGGAYLYGSNCTLMASPNNGYHFVNWTKNGVPVSSDISYTFTVTETADYVGHFALNQYQINASADPTDAGSVTGSGTYDHGETVTLVATANNGYHFVNWTKNGYQVSTNATYTFTATETADFVAHFEFTIVNHEVTTEADPVAGGTTTGDGTYAHGTFCTVTAVANEGYTFVNWTKSGNVVSTNAVYRFAVGGNTHLVAHFQPNNYQITASVDPQEGGTVTGAGTYIFGHTATLTITPNENYEFQNWTENDEVVSEDAIYSFEVTGDRNIVAHLLFVDGIVEQGEIAVLIYPNPASNILTIETSEPVNLLEIFTQSGALVYSQTDCPAKMEVQVGNYSNGTYVVRMTTDNTVLTRMFMKK